MFHPASMFYAHQLTTTRDSSSSCSDPGHQRDGPVTKLLRQSTSSSITNKTLNKMLVHVTVDRCFGPVHVVLSVENTVGDLIKAAIEVYLKECRRPPLANTDARCFQLHYSQFSLQPLKPEENLMNLESRNFFLCPKPINIASSGTANTFASSSCSNETKTTTTTVPADIQAPMLPLEFMEFLL